MAVAAPPVQLDNVAEAQVGNEVKNVLRNHDGRRRSTPPFGMPYQGAQRWTMEVIEMRVGDQNHIHRGKIINSYAGLAKPLQDKQPTSKIRIDDYALAADLQEEAGMPDEGHAHLPV